MALHRTFKLFSSIIQSKCIIRSVSNSQNEIKTCLYNFHNRHNARMTNFAGYSMPLQYKSFSIIDSNNWVREKCGLFDVSHMLQFTIHGVQRKEFIHSLTVVDVDSLKDDCSTLSLFTNPEGGIMDDTIITKCKQPHYYVVSNAGCSNKIKNHLMNFQDKFQKQGLDVRVDWVDNGLIALQGPMMASVLQPGLEVSLNTLRFGNGVYCSVFGIRDCRVTRVGYTGEDGVEISVPKQAAEELAEKLLENPDVIPVGLGARDTLRLEAGLCLYGNDIDETTTPVEASLMWTIAKKRRLTTEENPIKFPGFDKIIAQINKESPILKRRVGLIASEGPPPRAGAEILNETGDVIGQVTSGCFSPLLKLNICMGYVKVEFTKPETKVGFKIRDKTYRGFVTKLPFVKTKYAT